MSTGINISSSSGLTVGTTTVTSGTDGRVFFQAGGVVQQDANFTFDNTLKRLTLKAAGIAGTDIPFAVQNSAGSANLMQVAGDNTMTFLSSTGKIIFSQDTVGQGSVISLRRDFSNQEIIRLDGTNGGGITINPLNDGSVKSVAIGSIANGISMWSTGLTSHNFQIKNSFHNLFHVVGDPNSATATFRVGTTASNTNFFNVHGRNAGGTGLTTNPIFTINSSGTVGIGTEASTPGARLDVRAQGALSTDIAFRVRNSADTVDLYRHQGDGGFTFRNNANTKFFYWDASNLFQFGTIGGQTLNVDVQSTAITRIETTSDILLEGVSTHKFIQYKNGNFQLEEASGIAQTSGAGGFSMKNAATIPSASSTDRFIMYSTDITAGNAAPHFRTENGAIVKVYQETTGVGASTLVTGLGTPLTDTDTFDGYTLKQIVKALRNQGLLA